jgi:hypothetical protein
VDQREILSLGKCASKIKVKIFAKASVMAWVVITEKYSPNSKFWAGTITQKLGGQ